MKLIIYTYIAMGALVALSSCSQEEEPSGGTVLNTGRRIVFRASLPGVSSRAQQTVDIDSCYITSFDTAADADAEGKLPTFFENVKVTREPDNTFTSDDCVWPQNDGPVHFLAFHPSLDDMRRVCATPDDSEFYFDNQTIASGDEPAIDYRIGDFHIASDLSKQIDFITAYSIGNRSDDLLRGVNLDFKHQLSRVALSAWSGSKIWNIEIAGIRIGSAVAKADFVFSKGTGSGSAEIGRWENLRRETVQYIFATGDRIVNLADAHTAAEKKSIMGGASYANLIPATSRGWDVAGDSINASQGLYISVLVNVTDITNESHPQVYPYSYEENGLEVVNLEVNGSGEVVARLYKNGDSYYTDEDFTEPHTAAEGNSVRSFGWAAIPVGTITWEAGYVYNYELNFTDGVGLRDPLDSLPGRSVISDRVKFNVEISEWETGSTTNTTVPRK